MSENRHLISDAAKKLGIEPHVLRYWEEELSLTIHRNEMGHRYYTDTDLKVLENVHKLKDQGFQLKALKMIVPEMYANQSFDLNHMLSHREELNAQAESSTVVGFARPKLVETSESGRAAKEASQKAGAKSTSKKNDVEVGLDKETSVSTKDSADILSNEHKLAQFQEIMNRAVSKALADQQKAIGEAVGAHMSEEVSERVSDKVLKQMDYLMRESNDHAEERYKKLDETIREVQKARMEAAATNGLGKKKKGLFHKKEKKRKEKK